MIYLAVIIPAHSHPHPTDGSFAIQPMPYMPSGASVVSNCNATLCDGSTNPTTESGSLQQEIAFLSPKALRLGVNLHRLVQLTECAHKTSTIKGYITITIHGMCILHNKEDTTLWSPTLSGKNSEAPSFVSNRTVEIKHLDTLSPPCIVIMGAI